MMNDERMHVSVLTIDTPSQAPCTAAQRSTPASGSSLAAGAPRCEPSADRLCGGLAGGGVCLREGNPFAKVPASRWGHDEHTRYRARYLFSANMHGS